MKDFNVKLVNAYNKYVAIYKFRPCNVLEKPKTPQVRFLSLTGKG